MKIIQFIFFSLTKIFQRPQKKSFVRDLNNFICSLISLWQKDVSETHNTRFIELVQDQHCCLRNILPMTSFSLKHRHENLFESRLREKMTEIA